MWQAIKANFVPCHSCEGSTGSAHVLSWLCVRSSILQLQASLRFGESMSFAIANALDAAVKGQGGSPLTRFQMHYGEIAGVLADTGVLAEA